MRITRTKVQVGESMYELPEGQTVIIGRSPEAGVTVGGRDEAVSREHLRLTFDNWNVHIDDNRSTNGMFMELGDGRRVRVEGCTLDVGRAKVRVGRETVLVFIREYWNPITEAWIEYDPASPPVQALSY